LAIADQDTRDYATDPSRNVVLEASAGTGKTRVLVERYVNLLRAGVDPDHILAITFTRKAAAEMRDRIIDRLHEASRLSELDRARWRDLKDRLPDIAISTIDAFCLALVREFPLEADVDPGFDLAADADLPRLIHESLDRTLRICRAAAKDDDDVALVFAQLGERRLRAGLASLLDRRLVAPMALRRFLDDGPRDLTVARACQRAAERLGAVFATVSGGVELFLAAGPTAHQQFTMLAAEIRELCAGVGRSSFDDRERQAALRALVDRLRGYFMTTEGKPREKGFAGTGFTAEHCASPDAWRRHRQRAAEIAPAIAESVRAFRRDLNAVMARGVWRAFAVALAQYQRTLDSHALMDFTGVLEKAVQLLREMDEFAQSRYRLESRFRHVLVDELQDTSRAQWQLVAQLVKGWGAGAGAADDAMAPTIFVVGDRKQSIYGFRDADVTVLDAAAALIEGLRPEGSPRRAIAVSFRAVPALLAFVNEVCGAMDKASRPDAFRYQEQDRFPVEEGVIRAGADTSGCAISANEAVGFIVGDSVTAAAERVAAEVAQLLANPAATVRDRQTGLRRRAQPADIAILFRSRDSHRDFEKALASHDISTYVYKGLGFFDADEVQDVVALLRYLADPLSNLRAAALLRSRIVRLSDEALARMAPTLAEAVLGEAVLGKVAHSLSCDDERVFQRLRADVPRWLSWVDRMAPTDLVSAVLTETAYGCELRGRRHRQARENLKKLRAIIGRFQNRGYATLARVADHLDERAIGDESNAVLDAKDSVSLMTVHAAKGLEFPIVFVVNLGRGTGSQRAPIRVAVGEGGEPSVAVADYQSEADEDAQAREREETKRLLYVALTRARDRLYLSTTVRDGACRMGRGSLGEVLPESVKERFLAAAGTERPRFALE
jgi:ATP-dependent helicase/nuclease subunit A